MEKANHNLAELIKFHAHGNGLAPQLLAALIHQESGGNQWAIRYEPAFLDRYLNGKGKEELQGVWPKGVTFRTELTLRATSFGYCQILGQVARERGYSATFLSGLFVPTVNIEYGARILASHIHAHNDVQKGLQRYNGGGDPNYWKKVLDHIETRACNYLLEA